jgi:hypothetical protein
MRVRGRIQFILRSLQFILRSEATKDLAPGRLSGTRSFASLRID